MDHGRLASGRGSAATAPKEMPPPLRIPTAKARSCGRRIFFWTRCGTALDGLDGLDGEPSWTSGWVRMPLFVVLARDQRSRAVVRTRQNHGKSRNRKDDCGTPWVWRSGRCIADSSLWLTSDLTAALPLRAISLHIYRGTVSQKTSRRPIFTRALARHSSHTCAFDSCLPS